VERIIEAGKSRWPDKPTSAILVDLAEAGVSVSVKRRSDHLRRLKEVPNRVITTSEVLAVLDGE
jgi:hypothetical protein